MIIPYKDRLKAKPVIIFAVLVFLVQQFEHTDITFSVLTFAFIVISALAYNAGGGLSFPSGAYICFNALLTAIVGITFKLFLREPGESNLLAPNVTLLAYCVGMILMGCAAALSHRLRPKRALLPNVDIETMRYAALGSLLLGALVQLVTQRGAAEEGTFASALHQLNYLPRMALIFATVYQIAKSGGKSNTNWIVWSAGLFMFVYGVIGFTKEGMFVSVVTWLLTCVLYRFNFKWKQLAICGIFALAAQFILVPFSQYGRRSRMDSSNGVSQAMAAQSAIDYLKDPLGTRALYLDEVESLDTSGSPHLYTSQQPFMERLSMLPVDDYLIAYTNQGNVFGLYPTYAAYINVVPRFLWKDKPSIGFGNVYAHEIDMLSPDDTTTGISFSPIGDAYHQATWFGVLLVFPIVTFLYFFITDSLTGSVRDSPYALLPIALAAHAAPEGMMGGEVYLQTYGAFLLIVIVFLSKYVLARFTRLAMGGDRTRVFRTRDFLLASRQAKPMPQGNVPGSPPA
jgi:hypothetical protein